MIIEEVIRFLWGPYPLSARVVFENFGSVTVGDTLYPTYNFLVIGVGALAAVFLWAFIYRTRFGVVLRATSQDMRMSCEGARSTTPNPRIGRAHGRTPVTVKIPMPA